MEFFTRPRTWVILGVAALSLFFLYQLWHWEVERVEVPPGHFLVRVKLWGQNLPDGEVLAPDDSYKGIQQEVLAEGRHFLNPFLWHYEMHPMVHVPIGKCLVLTRKYGEQIPKERLEGGDFLAREGERGIVARPLGQGAHRLNPYAYEWQMIDAIEVGPQQAGVRLLKVGKDPLELPRPEEGKPLYVVPEGYKGVQKEPVPPGTYLVNPHVEMIIPVDLQSVTVVLTDISFPSRDGFQLNPHMMIRYRVEGARAPLLMTTLTDAGRLYQKSQTPEDIENNEILQKVILPLIRGYVRIEGSKFDARDFIAEPTMGPAAEMTINARERLQRELRTKVPPKCQEVGVIIEEIAMDRIDPQGELAELATQITEREQARLKREQNASLIEEHKSNQKLEATKALKQRESMTVEASTRLEQGRIKAEQRKEVETKRLEQELKNAEIRLTAAKEQAKATLAQARADAEVIGLQNEAEVSGLKKAVQGFPSPESFAQYHVLSRLAPALTEIFASDGSELARLFAGYMGGTGKPSEKVAAPAASGGQ